MQQDNLTDSTQWQHSMLIKDESNSLWQLPTYLWAIDEAGSCPSTYDYHSHYDWQRFPSSSVHTTGRDAVERS